MEIWKTIEGYEGRYHISNLGNVKSLLRGGHILKPVVIGHKPNNMYYAVNLHNERVQRSKSIHRMVALAFLANPDNLPLINHKDECTFNNHVSNLEWCTHQYNQEYSLSKKLYTLLSPLNEVVKIKNMRKFARDNGLNHAHLYQVHLGKLKSYKGWTRHVL